jgi:hypothetical protein
LSEGSWLLSASENVGEAFRRAGLQRCRHYPGGEASGRLVQSSSSWLNSMLSSQARRIASPSRSIGARPASAAILLAIPQRSWTAAGPRFAQSCQFSWGFTLYSARAVLWRIAQFAFARLHVCNGDHPNSGAGPFSSIDSWKFSSVLSLYVQRAEVSRGHSRWPEHGECCLSEHDRCARCQRGEG